MAALCCLNCISIWTLVISGDCDLGTIEVAEVTTTTGGVDAGLGRLPEAPDVLRLIDGHQIDAFPFFLRICWEERFQN